MYIKSFTVTLKCINYGLVQSLSSFVFLPIYLLMKLLLQTSTLHCKICYIYSFSHTMHIHFLLQKDHMHATHKLVIMEQQSDK